MKRIKKKKCRHCRRLFVPDSRNIDKQIYCRKPACKKASKNAGHRKWLKKPENKDYFKGHEHVERVRAWRKKNPGYSKRPKPQTALQDHSIVQYTENTWNNDQKNAIALQDILPKWLIKKKGSSFALLIRHPISCKLMENKMNIKKEDLFI